MRKLFIYLVLLALCSVAQAPQEPMLGELLDASQFDMPVGLWVMNEGAGSLVNDLSGNGNDFSIVGTVPWVSGKFGSALDIPITGNTNYGYLYPAKGFASEGTFVWWMNVDSLVNDACVVSCQDSTLATCFLPYVDAANSRIRCLHYNTDNVAVVDLATTNGSITAGVWIQVAYVYSTVGGFGRLYVNGVFNKEDVVITGTLRTPSKMWFGTDRQQANRGIDGKIDHILGFNRALSAQQIAQLYQEPFPWFKREPIELWEAAIAAPPPGGQVIFINFASMGYGLGGFGLVFILVAIRKMRKQR